MNAFVVEPGHAHLVPFETKGRVHIVVAASGPVNILVGVGDYSYAAEDQPLSRREAVERADFHEHVSGPWCLIVENRGQAHVGGACVVLVRQPLPFF